MEPNVFISSTYYDLHHVRERLNKFIINNCGYKAPLFERGELGYKYDKRPDESTVDAVKEADIFILIIGGRYGSPSTSQATELEQLHKDYEDNYVSVTRREFEEAIKSNKYILILINQPVLDGYFEYSKNKEFLDDGYKNGKYKPSVVDSLNVYRFIEFVSSKGRPYQKFNTIEDIENYLRNQFSSMMYDYLKQQRTKKEEGVVINLLEDLNNVTSRMNEMVDAIGQKLVPEDYTQIIENQKKILYEKYCENIINYLYFISKNDMEYYIDEDLTKKVALNLFHNFINKDLMLKILENPIPVRVSLKSAVENFNNSLSEENIKIHIKKHDSFLLFSEINAILTRNILSSEEDRKLFIQILENILLDVHVSSNEDFFLMEIEDLDN